jgi:hypothetical protein
MEGTGWNKGTDERLRFANSRHEAKFRVQRPGPLIPHSNILPKPHPHTAVPFQLARRLTIPRNSIPENRIKNNTRETDPKPYAARIHVGAEPFGFRDEGVDVGLETGFEVVHFGLRDERMLEDVARERLL